MNGYLEADVVVERICTLVKSNEIDKSNAREWLKFSRTISSTVKILEEQAFEILNAKRKKLF